MTLSLVYLVAVIPALALGAAAVAVVSTRRSAARIREAERHRTAG
jgi:hypothetical protein